MERFDSLKSNNDFRNLYRTGKSSVNRLLVLYKKENNLGINRLGISVSKKVGNSVVRHRIKRLIKESVRLNEKRFHTGFDLVIVARGNAKDRTYLEIESAVLHLAQKQKVLRGRSDEVCLD